MVANRTDDRTPLDNTNGGDDDENGANRALLTQDEDERAPDDSNIDDTNANDNQDPPQARAGDGAEFKVWNGLWPGPEGRVAKYITKEAGSMQDQKKKNGPATQLYCEPSCTFDSTRCRYIASGIPSSRSRHKQTTSTLRLVACRRKFLHA